MKISKREDFALIFMSILAGNRNKNFLSLSTIARKTHLSPLFLKHIASSLISSKLIISKEGIDGGYRLKLPPEKIFISQILQAVSNNILSPSCLRGVCRLKNEGCSYLSFWMNINLHFYSYLSKISLSNFINMQN
jgi:Rrf2 family iron-sulfur cluster assembly transcriptional regulator